MGIMGSICVSILFPVSISRNHPFFQESPLPRWPPGRGAAPGRPPSAPHTQPGTRPGRNRDHNIETLQPPKLGFNDTVRHKRADGNQHREAIAIYQLTVTFMGAWL